MSTGIGLSSIVRQPLIALMRRIEADGGDCRQNVPSEPIDRANQWGKKLFALPAPGFDTVEFYDRAAQHAGDNGLLSWVTGSVSGQKDLEQR